MNPYEQKVRAFHQALDLPVDAPMTEALLVLRKTLLGEELAELNVEIDKAVSELQSQGKVSRETLLAMLKEMADVQYVLSGMAVTFGFPVQEVFDRVHESNFSKLGEDGRPMRREDGKILKGPRYHPPILDDIAA